MHFSDLLVRCYERNNRDRLRLVNCLRDDSLTMQNNDNVFEMYIGLLSSISEEVVSRDIVL